MDIEALEIFGRIFNRLKTRLIKADYRENVKFVEEKELEVMVRVATGDENLFLSP